MKKIADRDGEVPSPRAIACVSKILSLARFMIPTRLNQTFSNGAVCGVVVSSNGQCALLLNKKYVEVFEECSVVN